ncbi:hypothetical protein Tco_0640687 [Tanacetum coccineum]
MIETLKNKSHDTIYENAKLRAQLFDKVSELKDTTHGTSTNTKFAKQSILGKLPSSFIPKMYVVTPLPKSKSIPKVGESNALSKQVTSNSVPSSQESRVVKNERVIAPGIFRINPFKASRYVNGMKSRKKNQSAKVSKSANQKKHKANVKKSKKSRSKESLALPSKPRYFLRWLPTGRIFYLCRKITSSSNTESESDTSVYEITSASNPQEPTNKGFPTSTSFLGRWKKDKKSKDDGTTQRLHRISSSKFNRIRSFKGFTRLAVYQWQPDLQFTNGNRIRSLPIVTGFAVNRIRSTGLAGPDLHPTRLSQLGIYRVD